MYRKAILVVFAVLVAASAIYALIDHREVTTSSDRAYEAYRQGVELANKLYTLEARQEFERAVQLDPQFSMAYARLAWLYHELGRREEYKQAKAKAFEFIGKVKDKERIQINLGFARAENNKEDLDKYSAELLDRYPNSLEAHAYCSGEYWKDGEIDKGIDENLKLIEIDPQYALAYNMLGYLYYKKGEYDKALDYIDQYSTIAMDQANPHDSHGEISLWLGRYDEALRQFQLADSIKPNLDFVVFHMGQAYFNKGMYRDALGAFLKAKELAINDERRLYYGIGIVDCYIFTEQYDEGIQVANEIAAKDPNFAEPHVILGIVYAWKGDLDKALVELGIVKGLAAKRTEPSPDVSDIKVKIPKEVMVMEAEIAGARKDYAKAISIYRELMPDVQYPEKFFVNHRLAEMYLKANEPDSAVAELTLTLKDNPNYPFTLISLAKAYRALGQTAAQREVLERLVSVYKDADDDFILYERARADLKKLESIS